MFSGFYREDSPYRLSIEKQGKFKFLARAFDKAGNYQEEEISIKIFSPGLIIISGGIQLKGVFFPWWLITLVLLILIIALGIIFWKIKGKRDIRKRLEEDIKEVEEKLEDIEKLKEEIKEKPTVKQRAREVWKKAREKLGDRIKSNHE